MYRIMIVEDDPAICDELTIALQNSGYQVILPHSFEDIAKEVSWLSPDLLLLDINLPIQNGFQICARIRRFSTLPIIFVTSRNTDMDELSCMTMGGDDFIAKPYNMPVLLARISVLLKRTYAHGSEENQISCEGLLLNLASGQMEKDGKRVELTKNEMKILHFLLLNRGKIVSRAEIAEYLWDNELFVDDNTLSVNVTRIRGKLREIGAEDFIKTKRGQGYMI